MEGKCVSVTDGDTITVDVGGNSFKIRLEGIDAPELKQEHGPEAQRYLQRKVLRKKVKIELKIKDGKIEKTYDRLVGIVYLGKEDICHTMLKEGLAWHNKKHNARKDYALSEIQAKKAGKGLWANKSALEPWKFRKNTSPDTKNSAHKKDSSPDKRVKRIPKKPVNQLNIKRAANFKYWISNSGKTHNRACDEFLGNRGTGRYSNSPSDVNAGCCGGAAGMKK